MLNLFLDAYALKYNRQDGFHFVDEDIVVETQYEHYLRSTTKQPTQDIKINEMKNDDQTYIEFQNKAVTKPPISIRASNYNGLAVNKMKDGAQNSQIWLLAENDDNVLRGQAISNFRMTEDNTGDYYPREVNIMFISLPRLAAEKSLCGNLSQHLMDGDVDGLDGELKGIAEMFKREFNNFKNDEEVVQAMTMLEERFAEGIAIGEKKGIAAYNARVERIIVSRIQDKEPIHEIKKWALDLGISNERFIELLRQNEAI